MLRIFVSNKTESFSYEHKSGSLEFGRDAKTGAPRIVLCDRYVSSTHLRIEELSEGAVQIRNLSQSAPAMLADGTTIEMGAVSEVALPTQITIGESVIEVLAGEESPIDPGWLLTISQPVNRSTSPTPLLLDRLDGTPSAEELTRWFESVINVQRATAGSPNFYNEIAQAVVELIGLDYALVLLRKGDDWTVVSRYATPDAPPLGFSRTVLDRVLTEKQTVYQAKGLMTSAQSLKGVTTVVASPVLDPLGEHVLGAVYAAKGHRGRLGSEELKPLHAQLVQVLAAAAGAGIARLESETQAARRLVQFEQFFSRELAQELDRNPELLAGQETEVTILVSDVRGFSRIAEQFSPRETCALMGDVLERLTARIKDHGGVVVDYAGDGILAMWNAPVPQGDHAARACRAAMAMVGELAGLNERWSDRIKTKLALGIGVNTGPAMVGNTGSSTRLKYGPLGSTVNLASRVEGVTKQFELPVLITETTHAKLAGSFVTRRLSKVRVVGIDTPVVLYELHGETAQPEWIAFRDAYESALALFEKGRLSEACRALFPMLDDPQGRRDQPALILASRAIEGLKSRGREFDPVIAFQAK